MKEIDIVNVKKKELLSLPQRKWDIETEYDFVLIVPTGKKHDSKYGLIAIIGYNIETKLAEIAAICDDVCWRFPNGHPYEKTGPWIRTDMYYPSNIIRMWISEEHYFKCKFKVGINVSSTDVSLVWENKK